jgi:Chaperone of endosialidase
MRKLLLGSIAVALAIVGGANAADLKTAPVYKAPPPPAPPAASGYVEGYTGWAQTETNTTDVFTGGPADTFIERNDGWPLGGAGRANYWFRPNASVQIDAQAEGTSYQESSGSSTTHFSTHAYLVAAHVNWRDSERGLLGVVGGAGDAGGDGLGFGSTSIRHGLFGGEGQLYWNQATLYLQGGYDRTVSPIDSGDDNVHAWFVRGTGRFFFDPNVMVEATGLFANGAIDFANLPPGSGFPTSLGFQTWLWQAKIEWRPGTIPFSFFAKYQGSQTRYDTLVTPAGIGVSESFSAKVTDNRFLLGVRLYMGQGTLQSNDRTGATLDVIDPLGTPTSPLMNSPITPPGIQLVSDIRLKRDIVRVAELDNGLGLYRYRYLWSDTVYVGVMAQEVAETYPESVVRGSDGYLRVNYQSLGLRLQTLAEWNALTFGTGL